MNRTLAKGLRAYALVLPRRRRALLVCYWTLASLSRRSSDCGALAAQIGGRLRTLTARASAHAQPSHLSAAQPSAQIAVEAVRTPVVRQRRPHHLLSTPRKNAAARQQRTKMGFGAGDIKDKFRTYDGDADKKC